MDGKIFLHVSLLQVSTSGTATYALYTLHTLTRVALSVPAPFLSQPFFSSLFFNCTIHSSLCLTGNFNLPMFYIPPSFSGLLDSNLAFHIRYSSDLPCSVCFQSGISSWPVLLFLQTYCDSKRKKNKSCITVIICNLRILHFFTGSSLMEWSVECFNSFRGGDAPAVTGDVASWYIFGIHWELTSCWS